jgi:hypothetical protein
MNTADHISESLETIFGVKILKFFDADLRDGRNSDPGCPKFGSGFRDKHPGSATPFEELNSIQFNSTDFLFSFSDTGYIHV